MTAQIFTRLYEQAVPFCLIDCRERRDYVNGHWFGSTNIPLSSLPTRLPFLCPDQDFPIHFLDLEDAASIAALRAMEKLGYQLSNSIENFNKAVGSLERNVLPGARKFKDLGANPTKELKELNQIETIVRKPNKE